MRRSTSERLTCAAWIILCNVPLGMAIANRSAPALLVAAAVCAVAGRLAAGEGREVVGGLRASLTSPLGLACLAFVALASASLAWSNFARISAAMLGELCLAAGAPFVLNAALPRRVPSGVPTLAALLVVAGCVWILAELWTGVSLRGSLGFRSESFIFKRSATAILIVLPPLALLAWAEGRRVLTGMMALLVLAAIVAAHSGAALVGMAAGFLAIGAAAASRRVAQAVLTAALLASLAGAPFVGDLAGIALPEAVLDRLHSIQARERVGIWQSFGEVVRRRPPLGTGFGTSVAIPRDPVAQEVPPERRELLAIGHPHNGYLQIWVELGLAGALVAAAILAFLMRGMARLDDAAAMAAIGIVAGAGTIMLVAHGAWQGWWPATLGAAATWAVRAEERA